jgi:flagellin
MGLGVLTNLSSFAAQNAFSQTQSALATSIQRLSSGLRINSGADDAAGLAISDRLSSQITGLNQAGRNVNDGISLVQTADGVLTSVSSQLQELRTLAVQASSSTYSSSDRTTFDREAKNLLNTIQASISGASFNGIALLNGSFNTHQLQVGAGSHQTVSITIPDRTVGALGSYQITTGTVSDNPFTSTDSLTINNTTTIGASEADSSNSGLSNGSAYALAVAINAQTSVTGVTASASTTLSGVSAPTAGTALSSGDITINGTSVGSIIGGSSSYEQGVQVQTAINAISATTGVTASVNSSDGTLTLNASDGRDIILTLSNSANTASGLFSDNGTTTTSGQILLSSAQPFSLSQYGSSDIANLTDASTPSLSALNSIDLTSASNASSAINVIDSAINQVGITRSDLGGYQNRFQGIVDQLYQSTNDASNARSRIRDTNFASETATLASNQLKQSIDVAMITQANTLPSSIAALLKGLPIQSPMNVSSASGI